VTRRLTWAIVGTVVLTLLLAGLGTLVLARVDARDRTRSQLEGRAESVAAAVVELPEGRVVAILTRLQRALELDGIAMARFGPAGRTLDPLPDGILAADLDLAALRDGVVVSGQRRDVAFAAAPVGDLATDRVLPVVVVSRDVDAELGAAGRWFVLAGGLTVLIGAVVAWRVGRRVAGPVRDVEAAARRLAAGDLTARVPDPPGGDDDELVRLVRSINAMASELERSRGLEQQFLLSVSHDLRTPLTSIRGWAEAIADGATPDPAAAAAIVLTEASRLERLVRDLLDLARLEARGFSLEMQRVDLADVAAGTAEGLRPDLEDAGLVVVVDAAVPVPVDGDPDRLAQVCANLVENAGRYARSTVRVSASTDGLHAVLAVEDDGPGFAAEDLPHVFERLYVARHRPARQESGSGLGLAIVRELAQALGGDVAAGVTASGGARLEVRLPLA